MTSLAASRASEPSDYDADSLINYDSEPSGASEPSDHDANPPIFHDREPSKVSEPSDDDAKLPIFWDLPASHRFYSPSTEGDLHTQLRDYIVKQGNPNHIRAASRIIFAINELASTSALGQGKMLFLRYPAWKMQSIHPIADLLWVASYEWTEDTRDEFLTVKPLERVRKMSATDAVNRQDVDTPVLPVFVFKNLDSICVPVDQARRLEEPPMPDRGAWICIGENNLHVGMVQDIVSMGIIVGPNSEMSTGPDVVSRRLDKSIEHHRAYLEETMVHGKDQILAVYQRLNKIVSSGSDSHLDTWGRATGLSSIN
ncbi:uncharacterized protein BKCO1_7000184 [Diplodia corticola]|uniref:Uncharacterized protein n=1 Tax=Diplodia corticola TaxID=236234 RepID=A0A1J9RBI3_9PEZI|nr:uncharacterized protein BKCO1_7000184 [Diplodia corticola]OJD37506.1 hypothetical protein BKCO1_7000184 [Diplodia corticola]